MKTNQQIAARHLANGSTYAEAAKEAGVSERSIYGWLKRPDFLDAVEQYRGQVVGELDTKLTGLVGKAMKSLNELLDDESSAVRLSAVRTTLDNFFRVHEIASFEKRITALEESANAHRRSAGPVGGNIDCAEVERIARRLLADSEIGSPGDGSDSTHACPAIIASVTVQSEDAGGRPECIEDRIGDDELPLKDGPRLVIGEGANARPIRNISEFMAATHGWKAKAAD
jgi:hypothetical protein